MEGYYNGTIFHRLVKEFIVQGGDPTGSGNGGESIYGETFKDEFHSRLRFTRRGLLAMANAGKNDNASQFFFTLGATPELQNKHTIFGKVTGDTLYNMLKLEEGEIEDGERPVYIHKIIRTEILHNPFEDIVPRVVVAKKEKKEKKKKEKGVKNFGLLSFGAEAEEDEQETNEFVQKVALKGKSTHDVLDDPKLSKDTLKIDKKRERSATPDIEEARIPDQEEIELQEKAELIRNKLKAASKSTKEKRPKSSSESEDDYLKDVESEKKIKKQKKVDEIKLEINSLKKQYQQDKKVKDEILDSDRIVLEEKKEQNELMKNYISERDKYAMLKTNKKKGASRQDFTLQLLSKFKTKLNSVIEQKQDGDEEASTSTKKDDGPNEDGWLGHTLKFEENQEVIAKDAATKKDDWYDVYDPRNPLNKRRRGEDKQKPSGSSRRK